MRQKENLWMKSFQQRIPTKMNVAKHCIKNYIFFSIFENYCIKIDFFKLITFNLIIINVSYLLMNLNRCLKIITNVALQLCEIRENEKTKTIVTCLKFVICFFFFFFIREKPFDHRRRLCCENKLKK